MTVRAMQNAAALIAGALFGAGLIVARATEPAVVLGFLDWFGHWDPSLFAMMLGALLVHMPAYRLLMRRGRPIWSATLALPTRTDLDAKLIGGAVLFGVGWGLGGYCPGPSVVALASGRAEVFVLLGTIAIGMRVAPR